MADDWRTGLDLNSLRADLGLPVREEPGLWDTVFQPVKGTFGALGNVGGQLLGLMDPAAYEAAGQELRRDLAITPESNVFERGEALPGLGDVAAQWIPESVKQSVPGQITGPVSRIIANALGDPTTYTPAVLGKVGLGALRGIPAVAKAAGAGGRALTRGTLQAASAAPDLQKAIQTGTAMQRAGVWMGQHAQPIDRAMLLGGVAYAPEIATGVGQAASESWRLAQEGKYGEAATQGASGALLAGLASLIGKGVFDTFKADEMLEAAIRKQNPAAVDAALAADRGELPMADILPEEMRPEAQGQPLPTAEIIPEEAPLPTAEILPEEIRPEAAAEPLPIGPDVTTEPTTIRPEVVEPEGLPPRAPEVVTEVPPEVLPPELPGTEPTPPAPEPSGVRTTQEVLQERQRLELQREQLLDERPRPGRERPQIEAEVRQVDEQLAALPEVAPEKVQPPTMEQKPRTFEEGLEAEPLPEEGEIRRPPAQEVEVVAEEPYEVTLKPTEAGKPGQRVEIPEGKVVTRQVSEPAEPIMGKGKDPAQVEALERGQELAETDPAMDTPEVTAGIDEAADRLSLDIQELTIKHGAKEPLLRLALQTLSEEVGRMRDLKRLRKGLVDSPAFRKRLKEVETDLEAVKEGREKYRQILKDAKERPLTDEEKAFRTQHEAAQKNIRNSPREVEIVDAGGIDKVKEIWETKDRAALQKGLVQAVRRRMELTAAIPDIDPRIINSLGDVMRRNTAEGVPDRVRDATASGVEQIWKQLTQGRKFTIDGEKVTLPTLMERFLDEGTEEQAIAKMTDALDKLVKGTGKARAKDILKGQTEVFRRPISEVIEEADEIDLRYKGDPIGREGLQEYASIREEGLSHAEAVNRLDLSAEDGVALNTLYATMRDRTKVKRLKELQRPVTEEGMEVEADTSVTLKDPDARDPYQELAARQGKENIGQLVEDMPREALKYKDRWVNRPDLVKYIEGVQEGLDGKALGDFIWGAGYPRNKLTAMKDVHDRLLGLKDANAKVAHELETAADSFFRNFLSGKSLDEITFDDDFVAGFKRMWSAWQAGDSAKIWGKGRLKGAVPAIENLRQWAGLSKSMGKGKVIEEVLARFKETSAATQVKLEGALDIKTKVAGARAKEAAEARLGGLLPIAKTKSYKPNFEGNLGERFPNGKKYSGVELPGNRRVYFEAAEDSKGERITILGGRGENNLDDFMRDASRRGVKSVEIPLQLLPDFEAQVAKLRRDGILGRPGTLTENAQSQMYPVNAGPPRTAAMTTDVTAKAAQMRAYKDYLTQHASGQRGMWDLLKGAARMMLGKNKTVDDLLQRVSYAAQSGQNMFKWDVPFGETARHTDQGPIRQMMAAMYLRGGNQIFGDFQGVRQALTGVQKAFGIDPDIQPIRIANGGFNSVFHIGADRQGRELVMKVGTAKRHLQIEDAVPESKSFMLPALRLGTTREGWNWRIEQRGTPLAIDLDGLKIPADQPASVGSSWVARQQKIGELADAGKVAWIDKGDWQWVAVDGKAYLADRGSLMPTVGRLPKARKDWIAQQQALSKPVGELSPRAALARDTQYRDAVEDATGVAVNFDEAHGPEFQKRLDRATGRGMTDGLDSIVKEMNEIMGLNAAVAGVTASPWLRGLYADGKIYVNPMEVLFRNIDNPKVAAEELVGTLIHEALHNGLLEHTGTFHGLADDVRYLSKIDGQFDRWVDSVEGMLNERLTGLDELMPEYREANAHAGSFGRESWRGEAGVREAPVHFAEGRATSASNRHLQGAADSEVGIGTGLQRGESVPPGHRRASGRLGEAALDRGVDARQAAEDTRVAARSEAEGRRIAAEATEPGVRSLDEAYQILDQLTRTKKPGDLMMNRALDMSFQIARRTAKKDPDELAALASATPAARGGVWARYNLGTIDGLSDQAKAAITLFSRMTRQIPELSKQFKADNVRGWDQLDREVKNLLAVKSKEDLYGILGKGRRGLSDRDVVMAKILGADLAGNVANREAQFFGEQMKLARGESTTKQVEAARMTYETAMRDFNEGMPKIINPLTETGRALAAAKKLGRAQDPEAAMFQDMRAGLFEKMRTRYKGSRADADRATDHLMTIWAEVRSGLKDSDEWAAEYRRMLKFSNVDKALEAYKAFLLGWKSRVANIASNTLVQGVRELERTLSIGMERAYSKLQSRAPERHWGEMKLNSMAMKHWGGAALPEWYQAFKDGLAMRSETMGHDVDRMGSLAEDMMHQVGAIEGKTGEFVRFMFKGMNAEDALFKKASQLQFYYRDVFRKLKAGEEGWSMKPGEDIYGATARYVRDIEQTYLKVAKGEAVDAATAARYAPIHDEGFRIAREETFQTELPDFMKAFQSALRKPGGKPFQLIFPFVRTPYNIAVETLRRTPAGFFEVASKWDRVSPAERMDLLARPMVGTMAGMWLINEAMQGNITGGGPIDPVDEANLRETGWRAYAVKAGDQYLSYQRLEPISSIVGMAADIAEGAKRGDFDSVQTGMTRLFSTVTENLTNKTFLSGLEGLSTAMSDPQRYAGQWIKQMQMSMVPNTIGPIPFGHLAQAVDPVYRQTEPMSKEAFLAKVPFLSRTLPPQYTPTGEERLRPGSGIERLTWPITRSQARTDPTAMAAQMLDQIGSPPTPPKKYTYIKGVKVYYTEEQRKMLAQAQSQATKIIGTRLVKDPNFMRLPDNEDVAPLGAKTKKDVVKALYDKYRRNMVVRFRGELTRKARGHEGGEVPL
ncbi:MAG: hypothetical protein GY906_24790 [bacterium]|nr:hypothetical protein [bacterium]